MEFQTRSEEHGLAFYETLHEALLAAKNDETVWKISWTVQETHERIRLVKALNYNEVLCWILEPIIPAL